MGDEQTLVRILDELLWTLRREGFEVSVAQAIDVARAVRAVGLEQRREVLEAVACIIVQHARDRTRFDSAFAMFFASASRGGSLWERLARRGFDDDEISVLRALLTNLGAEDGALDLFLEAGAPLDRLLALSGVARAIDAHSRLQLGSRTHRLLRELGAAGAQQSLLLLRTALVDALGARGSELADALAAELERGQERVRVFVRATQEARIADFKSDETARTLDTTPFASLADHGIEEVRHAVRRFAQQLRGSACVRTRHARWGAIDLRRTLRRGAQNWGVPVELLCKRSRRQRPRLMVLCDVSDSVRAAASFLLEFAYAAQELFDRTRSFVFVSDIGELTGLFTRETPAVAVARAWRGAGVVRASGNSNYGRALRTFEAQNLRAIDSRTTVVILGDGRTNYQDPAADVLDRIRARARALLWLCTERRGQWTEGDSAMLRYAPKCTAVHEVMCAADLERSARAIITRR
jgi:uncharacterized protein with von Willebrand factor type A (vWA) domain